MNQTAQLIRFHRRGRSPCRGTLVGIHDDGGDAEGILDWCAESAPNWDVCAPQAPRSRNPFQTGGKTVIASAEVRLYRGFCWTRRDPDGRTDPASLGDALVELADLLTEIAGQAPDRPIILVGQGSGGALARQLACGTQVALKSVIAIDPSPLRIDGLNETPLLNTPFYEVWGRRAAADRLSELDGR